MKKALFFLGLVAIMLLPNLALAANDSPNEVFEARVIKVINQREVKNDDGRIIVQQDLLLRGLKGAWKDKEVTHKGIGDADILSVQPYNEGDVVVVQKSLSSDGEEIFFATDYVRRDWLYFLAALFALMVVGIGGWKGVKSLISLVASFFLIIKFILPFILDGYNPLLIALFGSFAILAVIIYLTEGFNKKSHLAMLSVFITLSITLALSLLFTALTRLSGLVSDEAGFLIGLTKNPIDFSGLLLAGFLIGAVGVLDDVVVGQIESVRQLKEANPYLSKWQVFKSAYKIGNTHLGAIINTLFLTYAGASLPLLLLFALQKNSGLTFATAINNELVATEIVRTLVGSMGVALSMPIATALGSMWIKVDKEKK